MKPVILALLVLFSVGPANLRAADDEIAFLVFGDSGQGNKAQFEVARSMQTFCKKELCQFVTLLGDNFYGDGVKSVKDPQWKTKFHDPYDALNLVFYVSLGNHDYGGNVDAQVEYTSPEHHWYLPSRYYTFSKGDVDFIVIDTNRFDKKQAEWLKGKIDESRARWKIVYGHHPIYSYGSQHGDNPKLEANLLPLLKGKVDFYLAGHDHDKQVIRPKDGVQFVVSGASAETRKVKKGPNAEFVAATLGFAHLAIGKNRARLRFVDTAGKIEFEKEIKKD